MLPRPCFHLKMCFQWLRSQVVSQDKYCYHLILKCTLDASPLTTTDRISSRHCLILSYSTSLSRQRRVRHSHAIDCLPMIIISLSFLNNVDWTNPYLADYRWLTKEANEKNIESSSDFDLNVFWYNTVKFELPILVYFLTTGTTLIIH